MSRYDDPQVILSAGPARVITNAEDDPDFEPRPVGFVLPDICHHRTTGQVQPHRFVEAPLPATPAPTDDNPPRHPRRIQRQRTKGWRMPEGAIYVGRPTRWGNPFAVNAEHVQITAASGEIAMIPMTPEIAVAGFRDVMASRLTTYTDDADDRAYVEEWRLALEQLRGRDLACWCPLDQPCHADVLLEVANR